MNTKALTSAAIAGLLRPMLQDVNVVSAPIIAKERGIVVEETTREAAGDYESLITLTVVTERQSRHVSGTVFADGRPRIVNIKGIRMDAEFGPSMIYITNLDKPGFIGKFSSTLGDAGINIATFHVGREAPGGNAIALIEIDGELPPDVLDQGARAAAGAAGEAAVVLIARVRELAGSRAGSRAFSRSYCRNPLPGSRSSAAISPRDCLLVI